MSLDAGGLAQMTYNHHNSFANGLGVPGSGFASRGKGSHIKRLSVAPPSNISTIDETQQANLNPTPRTSRSHLLAGLRTAPRSPTFPTSAPPTQVQQRFGFEQQSRYLNKENNQFSYNAPQTAIGGNFPKSDPSRYTRDGNIHMYPGAQPMIASAQSILAPPAIPFAEHDNSSMDPDIYAELVATNQYLAQQQMRLQQQLINVTAAAQRQFQGMHLNEGIGQQQHQQQQQYVQSPLTLNNGYYNTNQQAINGLQPVIQAVANQPGVYSVYNPLTGQQSYYMDNLAQGQAVSPPAVPTQDLSHSPPPLTPTFRAQISPPPAETSDPLNAYRTESPSTYRSISPPKSNPSPPVDVNPLPPPSATAFRRSNQKSLSFAPSSNAGASSPLDGLKTGVPRSAGFPQTPMSGTFGPGQARAGEHPIRQPRGPPSLEELVAKPTAKHEGSKNFATRQRRRAVHNLVRAGLERRGASRGSGSIDSVGSMTPASECEITFSVSSDNDTDSVGSGSGSGSLSGTPSLGSLRAAANGAIGSERKELKERSRDRSSTGNASFTTASISGDEGATIGGKLVEVKAEESKAVDGRRKMPLLVLQEAEKRKSSIF